MLQLVPVPRLKLHIFSIWAYCYRLTCAGLSGSEARARFRGHTDAMSALFAEVWPHGSADADSEARVMLGALLLLGAVKT